MELGIITILVIPVTFTFFQSFVVLYMLVYGPLCHCLSDSTNYSWMFTYFVFVLTGLLSCICAILLWMASLDMSLDDMIKSRRSSERGRGQGRARRGRGRGPVGPFRGGRMTAAPHRGPLSVNSRPSSYAIAKASSNPWMTYSFC